MLELSCDQPYTPKSLGFKNCMKQTGPKNSTGCHTHPSPVLSKRADQLYNTGLFDLLVEIFRTNHWFWTSKSILLLESAALRWSWSILRVKSNLLHSTFLPPVPCHTDLGRLLHALDLSTTKVTWASLHTTITALEQTPFSIITSQPWCLDSFRNSFTAGTGYPGENLNYLHRMIHYGWHEVLSAPQFVQGTTPPTKNSNMKVQRVEILQLRFREALVWDKIQSWLLLPRRKTQNFIH